MGMIGKIDRYPNIRKDWNSEKLQNTCRQAFHSVPAVWLPRLIIGIQLKDKLAA